MYQITKLRLLSQRKKIIYGIGLFEVLGREKVYIIIEEIKEKKRLDTMIMIILKCRVWDNMFLFINILRIHVGVSGKGMEVTISSF